MKFLLDTHLLIWASTGSSRLSKAARALIEAEDSELLFSAASIWEIAIKYQLRRKDFDVAPRQLRRGLLDNNYQELLVSSNHGVTIDQFPPLHRDPFDRILVAQAIVEGIILLTADPMIARYPGPIRLV